MDLAALRSLRLAAFALQQTETDGDQPAKLEETQKVVHASACCRYFFDGYLTTM